MHRPTTIAQLDTNLRRHVYPFIGDEAIGSIRRSELQSWVKSRSEVLAPSTVILLALGVVHLPGRDRGRRDPNLAMPRREDSQEAASRSSHWKQKRSGPDRRNACPLSGGGGARSVHRHATGRSARPDHRPRRLLAEERPRRPTTGHIARPAPELAAPKTEASRRTIPLPTAAVEALVRHVEQYGTGPDGLLFTNEWGEPIRRTSFSVVWRPAADAVGIPKGTGMHALRHYYASLLIRHGESVKVVQSRLGHASAAETLDTYSHLWPDSEDRTRAAVDRCSATSPASPREISRTARGLLGDCLSVCAGQSACGGESVCTPDSVEDGHPSRPAVARRLQRSTRELDGPPAPCLTLLQVGFTEPSGSPRTLVRSYRTVAPLPVRPGEPVRHRRSVLCGTVLRVAPTGCYPAPCPVESGRSSDGSSPYATIRPAHHRPGIIARFRRRPSRGRRCGARRSSRRTRRTPRRTRSARGSAPA